MEMAELRLLYQDLSIQCALTYHEYFNFVGLLISLLQANIHHGLERDSIDSCGLRSRCL